MLKIVMPVGTFCESKRIKKDFNEQNILYSSKRHKHSEQQLMRSQSMFSDSSVGGVKRHQNTVTFD